MSERDTTRARSSLNEARIGELLGSAGEPQPLPMEDLEELRQGVKREWRARYSSAAESTPRDNAWPPTRQAARSEPADSVSEASAGSSRFLPGLLAAAAALLVGVASWWLLGTRAAVDDGAVKATVVGRFERVVGESSWHRTGETVAERPAPGVSIAVGDVLETRGSSSRLGLTLESGASVRLDSDAAVEWTGAHALKLLRGAVYVDSDGPAAPALVVSTDFGEVREIGTQFQVRVTTERLVVGVREGRVVVSPPSGSLAGRSEVAAGQQVTVDEAGNLSAAELSPTSREWDWVLSAAPSFDPAGRSVIDFFGWYERQTGVVVRFADPAVQARVERLAAGGGLGELEPADALAGVLDSSRLVGEQADGVLEIDDATIGDR